MSAYLGMASSIDAEHFIWKWRKACVMVWMSYLPLSIWGIWTLGPYSWWDHLERYRSCGLAGESLSLGVGLKNLNSSSISCCLSSLCACSWGCELSASCSWTMPLDTTHSHVVETISYSTHFWSCRFITAIGQSCSGMQVKNLRLDREVPLCKIH